MVLHSYALFWKIGASLDAAIRRTAHIQFLDSVPFIQMFVGLNRAFFD